MPLVKNDQGQGLEWFNEICPFYSKVQFCKKHVSSHKHFRPRFQAETQGL